MPTLTQPDLQLSLTHPLPSTAYSFSDNPGLESDWENDASDCENESDAQYIYIPFDSPFYWNPTSPCSADYLSFSGFPFACDALAQDDPLFARSPAAVFEEELQFGIPAGEHVVVVDAQSPENIDPWQHLEWSSKTSVDKVRLAPIILQT